MELVTGRRGSPHITSQNDRQKHQGIFGSGTYILNTGNLLGVSAINANTIQIRDGALMAQGALFSVKVGTVDHVTIANGTQGMQRKDVIVARYVNDGNTETGQWAVVQGTPAVSNPEVPAVNSGNIQKGNSPVDFPLAIVTINGINVESVERVPQIQRALPEIYEYIFARNMQVISRENCIARMTRIGNVVIAQFSASLDDTERHTYNFDAAWGPDTGFATPMIRNGLLATYSWLSKSGGRGVFSVEAAEGNLGTYTCTVAYYSTANIPDPEPEDPETSGMYYAGNGISISQTGVISVDAVRRVTDNDPRPVRSNAAYEAYGMEYTAGEGIDISPTGVISVKTTDNVTDDDESPVTSDGVYEVSKIAEQKLSEV